MEQINWLNERVKTRLAPSKVEGIGLFAIRDIAKGQRVYASVFPQRYDLSYGNFSKLFPEVREFLLGRWPQIPNGSAFFYPDTFLQSYCNHSDDPNYDASTDLALKDIKAGEELFEDYRQIFGYEKIYPWLVKPQKKGDVKKKTAQ